MGNLADLYRLAKFANRHPLATRNKARTAARFVRWQVASRTIRQPILIPFIGQTRLIISRTMPGAHVNYLFGLPEIEEFALALHFLRPGELMGDIGANIGALSIAAAGVAGARVIAMEPVPSTFRSLCDNVAVNSLHERVTTVPAGAGATPGMLQFSTHRGGNDRILTDGTGQSIEVKPLEDVFTETPVMLVLDVEGFEPAVIAGASRLLADPRLQIVIAETLRLAADYGLDERAMHSTLLGHGFSTVRYDPVRRRLDPTDGLDPVNTIYVRDRQTVADRVREAASFTVDRQVF